MEMRTWVEQTEKTKREKKEVSSKLNFEYSSSG